MITDVPIKHPLPHQPVVSMVTNDGIKVAMGIRTISDEDEVLLAAKITSTLTFNMAASSLTIAVNT